MLQRSPILDYDRFRARLKSDQERPSALKEIIDLISENHESNKSFIEAIGISNIFNCLKSSDRSQVELTCQVLKIMFNNFIVGDVLKKFVTYIMYLLRHDIDIVRRLAVDEINKIITTDAGLMPAPQYVDVFVAVAQLLCDSDVGIANKSIQITTNLPFEAYPKVLEEMQILLEYNSSCKCNVYEVIVHTSMKSFELLLMCEKYGYINFMVSELQSEDLLYHLNILELLSRMTLKPYGVTHLVECGALNKITNAVMEMKSNPMRGLLTPGYLKFFGHIAHHFPKDVFDKYPALLNLLFDVFESNEITSLPSALDTLGFIASTIEGKLCLAAVGARYIQTLEKLGDIIRNSPTDIRVRALQSYALIIANDKDCKEVSSTIDNRVTLMTREWFRSLSSRPSSIEVLFELCKNPFPEIRLSGLALLDAVSQHRWGQELIAKTAGFIEYLLDRSVSQTKETKEAQYEIIKKLANSSAFDTVISTSIQKYVEQGPFYAEDTLHVAMEDNI